MNHLQVTIDGLTHHCTWVAISTEAIQVFSDYGTRSVYLDGRVPRDAAAATLAVMAPANHR